MIIYNKLFLNDMINLYYILFSFFHYFNSIMPSHIEILLIPCSHIPQLFIAFLGTEKLYSSTYSLLKLLVLEKNSTFEIEPFTKILLK